jgi:hypothetical protein
MNFNVGDTVKLKPGAAANRIEGVETHRTAKIIHFLSDIPGGVVLDRRIGCIRFWNVEDLEPADGSTSNG